MSDFVDRWAELVLLTIQPGEHADCDPQIRARGSVLLPGAEESQLAEFETANGVRLPPSYREFLLRTNGALADLLPLRGTGVQPGDHDFTGFVGIEPLRPHMTATAGRRSGSICPARTFRASCETVTIGM